jgi:predicted DsbA family dithiol-disulfide isomerase
MEIKISIWSDVMCPFCYIGKRHLELAIQELKMENEVVIEWKSFQLNPTLVTNPAKNIASYLSEVKGWSEAQANQMNEQVTLMAKEVGLTYHLDKAIVANSLNAHRLSHLAKKYAVQNELEEQLFKAYFTLGANTGDCSTLTKIGIEAAIPEQAIESLWQGTEFIKEVEADQQMASKIGVQGVPFFVFNDAYAVSGAQPVASFVQVLTHCINEAAAN